MRCLNLWSLRIPVSLVLIPVLSLVLAASAFPLSLISTPAGSAAADVSRVTGSTPGTVLTFAKTAEPATVRPGDVVTYTLQLAAKADLMEVTVTDPLPEGVSYVPDSAGAGQYDPGSRQITWTLPTLAGEARVTLTFQVRVTGAAAGEVLNRAQITAAGYDGSLDALASVRVLPPPAEAVITPAQGGVLSAADGRVEVRFPPGAVERPVVARYVPQIRADGGFLLTFDLEAHGQTDGRPVTRFEQPVTVTVRYTAEDEAWLRARSVAVPISPVLWFFEPVQEK